jgi:Possible lysine decarboxylase
MMPLVLLDHPGGSYWRDLGRFIEKHLQDTGMISPEDVNLYKITNSIDDTIEEVLGFYSVYHSMRYVRDSVVFRLKRELSLEHIERLQNRFSDILVKGFFQQRGALPEEAGEPELADLPRLVFHFNRRNLGRLRLLINAINHLE